MSTPDTLKYWNPEDQPREKLLLKGVAVLSNVELIAIILGSGTRDKTAIELAREILSSCGDKLGTLAKMTVSDFTKFSGVGKVKAVTLVAAMELIRRRMSESETAIVVIKSSNDAYQIVGSKMMDLPHEEFRLLLLNKGMRLIKSIVIGKGGLGGVIADRQLIFKYALEHNASNIILVHNHPSGRAVPSKQDDSITNEITEAGKLLGIKVCDHLIIAGSTYYSYLDSGRLS